MRGDTNYSLSSERDAPAIAVTTYGLTCAGLSELWLIARFGLKVAAFFTALSTSFVFARKLFCFRRNHSSCRSTNDNPDKSTAPSSSLSPGADSGTDGRCELPRLATGEGTVDGARREQWGKGPGGDYLLR